MLFFSRWKLVPEIWPVISQQLNGSDLKTPVYSYHLSVLSFSLILIRVSISFQGSAQLSCSISQPTEKEILLPPSPFSLSQCAARPLLASHSLFLFWKGLSGYKMSCTKSLNFLFLCLQLGRRFMQQQQSVFLCIVVFWGFFPIYLCCVSATVT